MRDEAYVVRNYAFCIIIYSHPSAKNKMTAIIVRVNNNIILILQPIIKNHPNVEKSETNKITNV